jgi:hypothetical protein
LVGLPQTREKKKKEKKKGIHMLAAAAACFAETLVITVCPCQKKLQLVGWAGTMIEFQTPFSQNIYY